MIIMEHIEELEICTKPQKRQSPEKSGLCRIKYGGGDGIRTHGPVTVDGFQDRCLKPLGHTSVCVAGAIIPE